MPHDLSNHEQCWRPDPGFLNRFRQPFQRRNHGTLRGRSAMLHHRCRSSGTQPGGEQPFHHPSRSPSRPCSRRACAFGSCAQKVPSDLRAPVLVALVRGQERDLDRFAAMRHGDAGERRCRNSGSDAWCHIKRYAVGGEGFGLFSTAAEDVRDRLPFTRTTRLPSRASRMRSALIWSCGTGWCPDSLPTACSSTCGRQRGRQRARGQAVVHDSVAGKQPLPAANGQQAGAARAGADERDRAD